MSDTQQGNRYRISVYRYRHFQQGKESGVMDVSLEVLFLSIDF